MKQIDLTGKRFGLLTVNGICEKRNGKIFWNCTCDCGNKTIVYGGNLRGGAVKSCGCLNHRPAHNKTHGESQTKLYRHWISMIYRCTNPQNAAYKWYGARGIKVCNEWKTYEGFKQWVLSTRPDESYTVERIDVDGDYCPENCKWIPNSEQANNRTTNVLITYNGETKNLMKWCKQFKADYKLVHNRMHRQKWDFEKAIFTPLNQSNSHKKER